MKNKFLYITLGLLVTFTSCNDFLEKEPISDLTKKFFWKTPQDAEVGVLGIYDGFATAMSRGFFDWGEMRADNHIPVDGGMSVDQIQLMTNTLQNDNGAAKWTDLYTTNLSFV